MVEITKPDYLFEVSWEVCNKVGGIFTVVKSKAGHLVRQYKKRYFLIGPYFHEKAAGEFDESVPPPLFKEIFQKLAKEGIMCRFGTWLIEGKPQTILVEFSNFAKNVNDIKRALWERFGIDSLGTNYFDYDEPIVWSTAVGMLLGEVSHALKNKKIVGHFHEWLSAGALLHIKAHRIKIGTVFTTHATMLGRTLASSDTSFYEKLDTVNPEQEAYNRRIQAKHLTEKASAQNADVFTTVSEITALETEKLLGKSPDVLLPNGLNLEKFPNIEEISIKHQMFKQKIKEFLLYYFFPYYTFDLNNTLLYFLCGRYEFRDKGIDVFIKALGKLNETLKKESSKKTVVAFLWVPGNIKGIRPELLENRSNFNDVRDSVNDSIEEIRARIIYALVSDKRLSEETLFDKAVLNELKVKTSKLKKKGVPPLITHSLYEEEKDPILNLCKEVGLNNTAEDKVKVVFYSTYLTGADGLLDTSYYESMLGSQLGVFPSAYEPWGYTPLEAAALGVAAVTTDLAGFGRYISKQIRNKRYPGIFVLKRYRKSDDDVVNELTGILHSYAKLSKQERIRNKIEAKRLSSKADWKSFIKNYIKAHELAVKKCFRI